jgi:hypothetical protein
MTFVWPPAPPGPTPMDFFLWVHLREHVYVVWRRTVEDRLARLQAAVTAVDRIPCTALPSAFK